MGATYIVVGRKVGALVGSALGGKEGCADGYSVGGTVGRLDGFAVGWKCQHEGQR